ncbi:MAG: hypothetical protein Aurels2KO_10560 [Aureliella sp.]
MNLIFENVPRVKWYSDLEPFVTALANRVHDYVWRFDAVDCNVALPGDVREGGYWILNGDDLNALVADHPQFAWAVVSAIPKNSTDIEVAAPCTPFADGNPAFWTGTPTPQHPFAQFEFVCWDASATLLIGADDSVAAAFKAAYPESINLDRENKNRDRTKP